MDIEKLGYEAIGIIKAKYGLPMKGILCGGSLVNTIWELVSGNKSVINDIDIFLHEGIDDNIDNDLSLENVNDYLNFSNNTQTNFIYSITNSIYEGKINKTYFKSNKDDTHSLIKSFDFNCVQIGYSIENNKFYWTKEFEDFLKTGKIKITSLKKPSCTLIRLINKSKDLNIKIDDFEIELLKYTILNSDVLIDVNNNFSDKKYLDYLKNKKYLDKLFSIESTESEYGKRYSFVRRKINNFSLKEYLLNTELSSVKNISINFITSDNYLFYMRNIYGDDRKLMVWNKLRPFYNNKDYYDNRVSESDLNKISTICRIYPKTYKNINDMTLYDQSIILNRLLERFETNVAFSIIGKFKLKKDFILNDKNSLIFELSVRKESNNIKKNDIFNRIK